MLEERYGGAERYFRGYLKMSAADVQAIRSALVVDQRPIFGIGELKEEIEDGILSWSNFKPG